MLAHIDVAHYSAGVSCACRALHFVSLLITESFLMIAFLQRYNVGARLSTAFGLLILLSCSLVVAGLVTLVQARGRLDGIVNYNIAAIRASNDMLDSSSAVAINLRNIVLPTSQEDNIRFSKVIAQQRGRYLAARKRLDEIPSDAQSLATLDEVDRMRASSVEINNRVIDLGMHDKAQEALDLMMSKSVPVVQKWQDAIAVYADLQAKRSSDAYAEARAAMGRGRNLLIAGGVLVVLVSSLLAWLITRSLTMPLNRATRAAEAIAAGNLDNDVRTDAKDETGRLLIAMDGMQRQLRSLIGAQLEMAKRHDAGEVSHRIDAQTFPGDYGRMAAETNALVS
ncbi:MCP four helix bundle domain-containing protein, partial [Xanthomonas sp. MUS 060]|uniref:MCP four helix bundle domain-containing protein n=1 Tax=Xanthomonas sp. MUS 060 TaxID=1588031 RepID=UPI001F17D4B4